jgi:hypothetical protein
LTRFRRLGVCWAIIVCTTAATAGAASAARYASPTGLSANSCQTPATACDLATAIHGVLGNAPKQGAEVIVAPGNYAVVETIETGAAGMNVHGLAAGPRPVLTGSVEQILRMGSGGTFAYLDVEDTGAGEALFSAGGTLERMLVRGTSTGPDTLCQCYNGTVRDSVFVGRPGSTIGLAGFVSNGGVGSETLRNDTLYSEASGAPAIQLTQLKAKSQHLELRAYNTIAINAAGGPDVNASEQATIVMYHSDYAKPTGAGQVADAGGRVTSPPLFANAVGGDFRELVGSPTIGAGLTEEANGPLDFEGNARVSGGGTDIGAFQFQPAPKTKPGPKSPASTPPPPKPLAGVITGLAVNPRSLFAAPFGATISTATAARKSGKKKGNKKYGATISYRDSQIATTTFTVLREEAGRRRGKSCRKPSKSNKHGKRCALYTPVGTFSHSDVAGVNTLHFSGRLNGRKLAKGRYRLSAVAHNAAGNGPAATSEFKISG